MSLNESQQFYPTVWQERYHADAQQRLEVSEFQLPMRAPTCAVIKLFDCNALTRWFHCFGADVDAFVGEQEQAARVRIHDARRRVGEQVTILAQFVAD